MTFPGEACATSADCSEVALECAQRPSDEVDAFCIDSVCRWFCSAPDWRLCFRGAIERNEVAHADGLHYGNRRAGSSPQDLDKVTCPYLAALLENGDLTTNALGLIGGEAEGQDGLCAFASALASTGARSESFVANAFLEVAGGLDYTNVSIFDMVGTADEHLFDTGVRSPPGCCDAPNMLELASFGTDTQRNDDKARARKKRGNKAADDYSEALLTLSYDEFGEALKHFDAKGNDLRPEAKDLLGRVFGLILAVFGRGNDCPKRTTCYLTTDDLGRLFMEARFPVDWNIREWTADDVDLQIVELCKKAKPWLFGKNNEGSYASLTSQCERIPEY